MIEISFLRRGQDSFPARSCQIQFNKQELFESQFNQGMPQGAIDYPWPTA